MIIYYKQTHVSQPPEILRVDFCCEGMSLGWNCEVFLRGTGPDYLNRFEYLFPALRRRRRPQAAAWFCPYCGAKIKLDDTTNDPTSPTPNRPKKKHKE